MKMTKVNVDDKFAFLTWNIDGLDDKNIKERTLAVITHIQTSKCDVIFLQEVVSETYNLIHSNLSDDYYLTENKAESSEDQWYFTLILVKKFKMVIKNTYAINFPNSTMGRDLTIVDAKFNSGEKLMLLNTHLESMKQFSKERMEQLRVAFEKIRNSDENSTVIFAGDLNVRDSEVEKVGIPAGIEDIWVTLGEPKEYQFTWDLTVNTNKKNLDKKKPRFRFDRVYFKTSAQKQIAPKYFRFCGTQKVPDWKCFPSDHFGIICEFKFRKKSDLK